MHATEAAILVQLVLSLGGFIILLFVWRQHAVDKFRQQAFTIRDELFDLAAANPDSDISFDSQAYRCLRRQMNSLIRFAHHISAFRAWLFLGLRKLFFPDGAYGHFAREREAMIVSITDPSLRRDVEVMFRTLNWNIIKLCAKTSPVFFLLMCWVMLNAWRRDPTRRPLATWTLSHPTLVHEDEGIPVPASVKKATSQRMRDTHEAIWTESSKVDEAEALAGCS